MSKPDYTLPLDQLPDPLPIEPLTRPFDVTITPPGSKSITCRAYVLAALAQGESKLIRPLRADDTDLLLKALCTLGAEARWEGEDVYIKGVGGRFPRGGSVNLGDGGTPTRFMIACACLAAEPVVVDGSKRMRERPIAEGVEMLRQLGAMIECIEAEGRLPVRVTPSEKFVGGEIEVGQTQSSQFISALMLIAPCLRHGLRLAFQQRVKITSREYKNLTGAVMAEWGLIVAAENYLTATRVLRGDRNYETPCVIMPRQVQPQQYAIESDASSAAYWVCAAAVSPQSKMHLQGLPRRSKQPDGSVVAALNEWSIHITEEPDGVVVSGKVDPMPVPNIGGGGMPDGILAIAAITATMRGSTQISDLATLRVKETDRIAALANELRKVGCSVETGEDWIEITPATARASTSDPPAEPGAKGERDPIIIETYNDHRMAMAFAVLGLAAPNGRRLAIRNPGCVAKSYPTFWKDFAKLYQ